MPMPTPAPSSLVLLALLPLLLWRLYARFRRMVGRQRLSRIRPWITLTVFPLIVLLLALGTWVHPERLGVLAVGLAAGGALAVYGLGKTRFEATAQGLFYEPNAHLGIALSLVFFARIAYRMFELYTMGAAGAGGGADFARSPLTLAVFGVLAGYYVGYAIGLVRWRRQAIQAKAARDSQAPEP